MADTVVVIYCDEDGDLPRVRQMSKEKFLERLNDDWKDTIQRPNFAEPTDEIDTSRFAGYIVIEGKIVKPRAIKVTSKWIL